MRLASSLAGALCCGGLFAATASGAEDPVHEVRRGETLWSIARSAMGDPGLWPLLYRANRDQIKHPSLLHPGQRLAIPVVETAADPAVPRTGGVLPTE